MLVPLGLYRDALAVRPMCHSDQPSTLIQVAAMHFSGFQKLGDEVDGAQAQVSLQEAMKFSSADSHENRVAAFMLQLQSGPSQACPS